MKLKLSANVKYKKIETANIVSGRFAGQHLKIDNIVTQEVRRKVSLPTYLLIVFPLFAHLRRVRACD